MSFFGIVILLFLVYLFIVRPLTRRSRTYSSGYGAQGPNYGGYYNGYPNGPTQFGSAAGGVAAGALLTLLLEEGRISQAQYDYYDSMPDGQMMMNDLMEQNIVQQNEIDDLRDQLAAEGYDSFDGNDILNHDDNNYDNGNNSYDDGSSDNSYDDGGSDDGGGFDGGDDGNWM